MTKSIQSNGKSHSIGSLIYEIINSENLSNDNEKKLLATVGISVSRHFDHVHIHSNNTEFRKLFSQTEWIGGIKPVSRLPGVEKNKPCRIGNLTVSAYKIPIELILPYIPDTKRLD